MLFKLKDLQRIKSGEITLAFRKWKRPSIKQGSLIKTAIGQIEILGIVEVSIADIDEISAKKAGYTNASELISILQNRSAGTLYKIRLAYHSPDPRLKLREETALSPTEFDKIKLKLTRFDKASKQGPWTLSILQLIDKHPQIKASELATLMGKEKAWFKLQVRKLKNMGLTISHGVGYSLSPRGEVVLEGLLKA